MSEEVQLYPSEHIAAKRVREMLQERFQGKNLEDPNVKRQFGNEARFRFAEVGLNVDIEFDYDVADAEWDNNLYVVPTITITGRTEKESETDHDRIKHEVQAGVADGVAGVIREDGTLREDPKSKTIY